MDHTNKRNLEKSSSVSRRELLKGSLGVIAQASLIAHPATAIVSSLQGDVQTDHSIRLDLNENPFGPSPKAMAAGLKHLCKANQYLDPAVENSYSALSKYHDISTDMIVVGVGSSEILRMAPLAYYEMGANVVSTLQTYRVLLNYAQRIGLMLRTVDHRIDRQGHWHYDIEGLLGAVDFNTRLLYLVNPNNPTGAMLDYQQVKFIADSLPAEVLFLVDEAYFDFVASSSKSVIHLVKKGYKNIMVTRTFSKVYGLAGLRVGYGVAHPEVIERFQGLSANFLSINTAGFYGAIAALKDIRFRLKSIRQAWKTLSFYKMRLPKLGYPFIIGQGPFIMVNVFTDAEVIVQQLAERNILVANGDEWDMPSYIRISYGTDIENQQALKALRHVLGA